MDILRVVMFKFCALHENPMPLLSLSYSCGGKELLMEYNPGGPPPQGYGPVLFTITTTATERKKRQRSNKVLYVFAFRRI